jgi:hypothetical protein
MNYTRARQQRAMERYGWEPARFPSWTEKPSPMGLDEGRAPIVTLAESAENAHRSTHCGSGSTTRPTSPARLGPRKAIGFRVQDMSRLARLVDLVGLEGSWRDLGNQKQFRASSGAVLNWWKTTGTILFQGPDDEAAQFELQFLQAVAESDRARKDRDLSQHSR